MDFLTWALLALSVAFAVVLAAACLVQVLWLGRTVAGRLQRMHLPRH